MRTLDLSHMRLHNLLKPTYNLFYMKNREKGREVDDGKGAEEREREEGGGGGGGEEEEEEEEEEEYIYIERERQTDRHTHRQTDREGGNKEVEVAMA